MIGIIGAMEEEVELLKGRMTDKKEQDVANCQFISGKLEGADVVLLKSGIGKVNAAMATAILAERFAPDFVINTGSAGGFSSKLEVGDLVISENVVHHDVDVTAFDYKYGQVPGMPEVFAADTKLIEMTEEAVKSIDLGYEVGLIATADTFMADPARVAFAREKFPNMIAAEMEAAAIAQVCWQYNIPFVIIRALSDIAGKESAVTFDEFIIKAGRNAAELIIRVVSMAAKEAKSSQR
ncbi:5'-methylthioadenosine/S-adenosylhomocysteine nucleosidase [Aciduricibacillus chroicocephali]|uniref:5'-methylthioadenosine/S-adenosylhomocysteine nucleosidase n=1 Tax=Aciduricibacillus chroicocephali TaxID=3054939 RepID=A0ABY9KS80_9BACI|nr:5'-methylthioadenosine/S-adenosylhomocysteine nucleosidase [Bacillaceae bacterium 44XB]